MRIKERFQPQNLAVFEVSPSKALLIEPSAGEDYWKVVMECPSNLLANGVLVRLSKDQLSKTRPHRILLQINPKRFAVLESEGLYDALYTLVGYTQTKLTAEAVIASLT